jgi:uncharacterized membrane protein
MNNRSDRQNGPQDVITGATGAMAENVADAVWTYRGYRLRPSEFNTAMVHLFRAEVTRQNTWRNRLDVTTNWALVATGAAITFAFSENQTHHSVIILNTLLITLILYIEARRYRYYELWSYRVRLMETDFYAAMLVPPFKPDAEWGQKLAESLLHPRFPISMWEAFGRRLRRNYIFIYMVLALSWLAKVLYYPAGANTLDEIIKRSAMGVIPGWVVLAAGLLFNGIMLVIGVMTWNLRQATGEVLPRYGGTAETNPAPKGRSAPADGEIAPPVPAAPDSYLALVSSEQLETLTAQIQKGLKRPVTPLNPDNTSGTQSTLMIPVQLTEIQQLKTLVRENDPQAVVIVVAREDLQKVATAAPAPTTA